MSIEFLALLKVENMCEFDGMRGSKKITGAINVSPKNINYNIKDAMRKF
jgi:hypothetical protein